MRRARLLIGEADPDLGATLAMAASEAGHEVRSAKSREETLALVRSADADLLLQDVRFLPTDGVEVTREVKRLRPSLPVVLFGSDASRNQVIEGFRAGALDFVLEPVSPSVLHALALRAVELRRLGERRRRLAQSLDHERQRVMELRLRVRPRDPFRKILGDSDPIRQLRNTIREIVRTDSNVLITGESGTGKSLVARTIHESSARAEGPFVEANCAVYTEGALRSELFGHEPGPPGVDRTRRGRFELACGGTLFLDQIGEVSEAIQRLLIRVLDDRVFARVGGTDVLRADVRVIASTERDLGRAVHVGSFRRDLHERLNGIPLRLTSLRERVTDVPLLARHFLDRCCDRAGRDIEGFTPAATEAMMRHAWPGNVGELEDTIERIVTLRRSGTVDFGDLPPTIRGCVESRPNALAEGSLRAMEREQISEALRRTGGNKRRAASELGIHRSTLYAKLRRYGIEVR